MPGGKRTKNAEEVVRVPEGLANFIRTHGTMTPVPMEEARELAKTDPAWAELVALSDILNPK